MRSGRGVRRLLAAHTALVYLFLYAPIAILMVFSFNAARQTAFWQGFTLDDVDRLRTAFVLAKAILEGRHRGADYRTFSRRIAGESKALERVEGPVVRLLSSTLELPPGARP